MAFLSRSERSAHFPGRARLLLPAALLTALVGCSDDNGAEPMGGGVQPGDTTTRQGLRTLADREAFMSALRAALVAQRADQGYGVGGVFVEENADVGIGAPTGAGDTGGSTNVDQSASAGGEAADGGGAVPGGLADVTSTNVQEAGVDERDRVKNDGEHLFVLESGFSGYPVPIDGPQVEFDIAIDGTSQPAPDANRTVLRVLRMDRETPDAVPLRDIEVDLDGRYADGFYLYGGTDDATAAYLTASGNGGYWESWGNSVAFRGLDTLIARVPTGAQDGGGDAAIERLQIDGQTVSSRRIGKHLFLASRFYPNIADTSPYDVDQASWERQVTAASDDQLLPGWSLDGGERRALIDPADCFVAERPQGNQWYSPDIVTLSMIDLDTMQPVDSECYLGASETLYASPESVYLATTRWDYAYGPLDDTGAVVDEDDAALVGDVFWSDPRVDTDIHRFDIADGSLGYVGSGSVRGHLGWNELRKPYRMSAREGVLRVATIAAEQGPDKSPIIVSALRSDGQGTLERIAELPNERRPEPIGKPGEQLYASRFVGDRAYLVTFRQTDPLYVVDLSRPADPEVLGELEISGYSEWLQPIGANHLLGIGKDAVPVPGGFGDGRGGLYQGIKVSLFDVTDPVAPREVQSLRIGERGSEAGALFDARAITVQPANDSHPTRVTFGIDVHGNPSPASLPPVDRAWEYQPWRYTGLYGFDVRVGDDAGIEQRGVMISESAGGNGQYYGSRSFDDRSVIADDAVYYVHGSRVRAALWGDFGTVSGPR